MNKIAMSGAMLAIIIGAIFIVIVVVGPFSDMVKYVREKFFSGILTPKQQETVVGIPGAIAGPSTVPTKMLSDKKEIAIAQLVEETIICWKDFERNGYLASQPCKRFEVPSTLKGTVVEKEYRAALAASGDLGYDISGDGALGADPDNYFWFIGTLKSGEKPFFLCGDDDSVNEVGFTRNPDGGDCH